MKIFLRLLLSSGCLLAQPKIPRPAPALNLLQACHGRPTLLAFINTGCLHCKWFTSTVMEPMYEAGKACAIAAAFDEDGDLNKFVREQKIRFPLFRIERSAVREFMGMPKEDSLIGTPQVVVIDRKGMIQAQSAPAGSPFLLQREVIESILGAVK